MWLWKSHVLRVFLKFGLQFSPFLATLGAMTTSMRVKTAESTLILRAHIVSADREIVRQIGVNNVLSFEEFHRILNVCFDFSDGVSNYSQKQQEVIDDHDLLADHLRKTGDQISHFVGLWCIEVEVIDAIMRDQGTPHALCIGGYGQLHGVFDMTAINAQLTGDEAIEQLMATVTPEVSSIIKRSGILDFIPLLQAIDFSRHSELESDAAMICAVLPVEEDPKKRDAFWATVLSLSCMCDAELTDHIIESVTHAIGWEENAGEVRELCAQSLKQLDRIGGLGSPVDRLDIYRELLRL